LSTSKLKVVDGYRLLRQQVCEKLREAILEMRLLPGDRLIERKLCEETGVSRPLIREALRQLETEGLITVVPHKGPLVTVVDAAMAQSIYEVRAVLESFAAAAFAERASEEQRERLKRGFHQIERAYRGNVKRRFLPVKAQFYSILLEGTANPVLTQMLPLIHGRITLLRTTTLGVPGRLRDSLRELRAIVEAIDHRNPDAAAEAARKHVQSAAALAAQVLEQPNFPRAALRRQAART
jgi:DNA-binding GntR family transcriptional regulator